MATIRMYGLFEKVNGKWNRLKPTQAYKKATAVRVFQNDLLNGFFGGKIVELRALPKVKEPEPATFDGLKSMFTFGAVLAHKNENAS